MNNKTITPYFIILLGIISLNFNNCAPPDDNKNEVILSKNLIVLDDSDLSDLSDISENGDTFTFTSTNGEYSENVEKLEPGQIIASAPFELAPNGFLRKIEEVIFEETQIIVITSQATLPEAVIRGNISIDKTISNDDITKCYVFIKNSKFNNNLFNIERDSEYSLNISIDDFVIYEDPDTGKEIELAGDLSISPSFSLTINIEDSTLKSFRFTNTTEIEGELSVYTEIIEADFDRSLPFCKFYFNPIIIQLGVLPIIITPVMEIIVGAEGRVAATIGIECDFSANFTTGIEYKNGNWIPITDSSLVGNGPHPEFEVTASLKGYVGPQLNILLYGLIGPYVLITNFLELESEIIPEPCVSLTLGLEVSVGLKSVIIKLITGEESDEIAFPVAISIEQNLIEYCSTPNPTPIPNSDSIIIATSESNGNINPYGNVNVCYGCNQSFTISANSNYHILDVLIDGISIGSMTSYTFYNVIENHTIHATFELDTITDEPTPTPTAIPEIISRPNPPSGPSTGDINVSYTFCTSGSSSNHGHDIQYRFLWGDGSYSAWSTSECASHTWNNRGSCIIRAEARCSIHPDVVSQLSYSSGITIHETGTIFLADFSQTIIIPDNGGDDNIKAIWEIPLLDAPTEAIITGVDFEYYINHTYVGNLFVWLTTLNNQQWFDYTLWDREGGNSDNINSDYESDISTWNDLIANRTFYLSAKDFAPQDEGYIWGLRIWVHWRY